MTRKLSGLLIALLGLVVFASVVGASDSYRVVRNVRLLTTPNGQRIKTLHSPDIVTAIGGRNGDYIQVRDNTQDVGWAYQPYLELVTTPVGSGAPGPPSPTQPGTGMEAGPQDASAFPIAECPPEGDATKPSVIAMNPLKNRLQAPPAAVVKPLALSAILAPGDDTNRWSPNMGTEIVGYVENVKSGGPETCNCHATDPSDYDTHIELSVGPPNDAKSQRMIVEVTPPWRRLMQTIGKDWSTTTLLTTILHQRIRVRGWMFFDGEHANAAQNTHPSGSNNWRGTAWEIHPITAMQLEPTP